LAVVLRTPANRLSMLIVFKLVIDILAVFRLLLFSPV
jgi:hypothetical protein